MWARKIWGPRRDCRDLPDKGMVREFGETTAIVIRWASRVAFVYCNKEGSAGKDL